MLGDNLIRRDIANFNTIKGNGYNEFLRSPNVGNTNNVRIVNTTGVLNNNNANNNNGFAPDYI